ncbi:1513_t:CDS:2, partial [Dentiscutata heterogama]
ANEVFDDIFNLNNNNIIIQNSKASISQIKYKTTSKKLRKLDKSWIWNYMKIEKESINCEVCKENLSFNLTKPASFELNTATRNMIQHLLTVYQINEYSKSQSAPLIIQPSRQEDITFDLVDWIIDDMQAFSVIKNKKFRKLINNLYSNYQIPAIRLIKNIIFKAVQHSKDKLKQLFNSTIISASFTTDEWISNHKPYIGVTIYWIFPDFKLHQVLLSLEKHSYPYTALNIFQKLKSIFEKFKIEDKFIVGVTDNAANMVATIKKFENIQHLRCVTHTIQISIKYGIEKINRLMAKISKLNKYIVNYDKYYPRFKSLRFIESKKANSIIEFIKAKILEFERLENIIEDSENLIPKN